MRLIVAALALTIAATPAIAADAGSLTCIESRLGGDSMARIGTRLIAALDAGESPDTSLDVDREAVITARNSCREANKWSNDATDTALSYTKAGASLIGGETAVKADGIDPVLLKAAYAGLATTDRRSLSLGQPMTKTALAAITSATAGTKSTDTTAQTRMTRHAIIYLASISAREFYPAQFASE
jgi:hypothetical protein